VRAAANAFPRNLIVLLRMSDPAPEVWYASGAVV
jgi:hypothetical protein